MQCHTTHARKKVYRQSAHAQDQTILVHTCMNQTFHKVVWDDRVQ